MRASKLVYRASPLLAPTASDSPLPTVARTLHINGSMHFSQVVIRYNTYLPIYNYDSFCCKICKLCYQYIFVNRLIFVNQPTLQWAWIKHYLLTYLLVYVLTYLHLKMFFPFSKQNLNWTRYFLCTRINVCHFWASSCWEKVFIERVKHIHEKLLHFAF